MRPPASPVVRRTADGVHPIAAMAPLKLNAAEVARVGAARAAFDAVREHPFSARSAAAARAAGHEAVKRSVAARASLARRSAEAYAKQKP